MKDITEDRINELKSSIHLLRSYLSVWFFEKRIPMVPLFGGLLITFFGGLTIYFDNPIFIYVKPTIINILFGLDKKLITT